MHTSEISSAGSVSGNGFVETFAHVVAYFLSLLGYFIDFFVGKKEDSEELNLIHKELLDIIQDNVVPDEIQRRNDEIRKRNEWLDRITNRYAASKATVILTQDVEGLSDSEKLEYIKGKLSEQDEDVLLEGAWWPKGWSISYDHLILPGDGVSISNAEADQLISLIKVDRSIDS